MTAELPLLGYDCHRPAAWLAALGLLRVAARSGFATLHWAGRTPVLTARGDEGGPFDPTEFVRAEAAKAAASEHWAWLEDARDPVAWGEIPDEGWKAAVGAWEPGDGKGGRWRGGRSPLLMTAGRQNAADSAKAAAADAARTLTFGHFGQPWRGRYEAPWLGLDDAHAPAAYRWNATDTSAAASESPALWLALEALPLFPCVAGGALFTPPLCPGEDPPKARKSSKEVPDGPPPAERLKGSWATNRLFPADGFPDRLRLPLWSKPLTVEEVTGLVALPWHHQSPDAPAFAPVPPAWSGLATPTVAEALAACGVTGHLGGRRYLDGTGKYWRLSPLVPA